MIGILIAAHSSFGCELIKSYQLIVGKTSQLDSVGLFHGDNVDNLEKSIESKIKELDTGDGVLILCDLFGGSPSNCSAKAIETLKNSHKIECIEGANLPMLIEALSLRDTVEIHKLKYDVINVAKDSIIDIRSKFNF